MATPAPTPAPTTAPVPKQTNIVPNGTPIPHAEGVSAFGQRMTSMETFYMDPDGKVFARYTNPICGELYFMVGSISIHTISIPASASEVSRDWTSGPVATVAPETISETAEHAVRFAMETPTPSVISASALPVPTSVPVAVPVSVPAPSAPPATYMAAIMAPAIPAKDAENADEKVDDEEKNPIIKKTVDESICYHGNFCYDPDCRYTHEDEDREGLQDECPNDGKDENGTIWRCTNYINHGRDPENGGCIYKHYYSRRCRADEDGICERYANPIGKCIFWHPNAKEKYVIRYVHTQVAKNPDWVKENPDYIEKHRKKHPEIERYGGYTPIPNYGKRYDRAGRKYR